VQLLRTFNEAGISEFRLHLERVRTGVAESVPHDLLFNDSTSTPTNPEVEVDQISLSSKLEAAQYLSRLIKPLNDPFYDVGLWTWLSAFFFDSVCPRELDGTRKPKADYRHILQAGRDWWHFYRHLLAGPVRTYHFHGETAKLLLSGPLHKLGDFVEQLASRQEVAANRNLIEAATLLYWDEKLQRPKRGAAPNTRKPGTLRRFVDMIQQFELTYDLYSMSGEQFVALLPQEFSPWKAPRD